jgi:hypothetical protein
MRRGIGAEERKMTEIRLTDYTAAITNDAIHVRDPRGRIWYPDEEAEAEIRGKLVVCESPDGYSIHAPGSTDAEIASGDAPPLVSGPWTDDEHVVPASAFDKARLALAIRICAREPMRGTWKD